MDGAIPRRSRRGRGPAFAFAFGFALFGACLLPGGGAEAQWLGSSPGRDVEQGMEVAKEVERDIGLYEAPRTEAWVREVGARLVEVVGDRRWQFRFQVVDQAEPNAFAIPGGGVYVSRGLLALVNREDELAGVLAHEIAHVTCRHSARQQRRGILPGLLSLPGNVVGRVVGENLGALVNAPVDALGGAWMSRYSRSQESESDRIGIQTAALAGYQPSALADILVRLEQDVRSQTGQERRFSIFDSHPMTDRRKEDIQQRAGGLKPAPGSPVTRDRAALLACLDGIWWGENPENGVFRGDQFLHPGVGFTLTFPKGWTHRNTPRCVASSAPEGDALLLLGVAGPAGDPEAFGARTVGDLRTRAGVEPVSARRLAVGDFPAYVVTYLASGGRAPVYLHFGWVAMGRFTYQLTGVGPESRREVLRDAAWTLRPLTPVERGAVTGLRLRVVGARRGERLEDLGARTGNAWSASYTALVNGWASGPELSEGQPVKIARTEPAVP